MAAVDKVMADSLPTGGLGSYVLPNAAGAEEEADGAPGGDSWHRWIKG